MGKQREQWQRRDGGGGGGGLCVCVCVCVFVSVGTTSSKKKQEHPCAVCVGLSGADVYLDDVSFSENPFFVSAHQLDIL